MTKQCAKCKSVFDISNFYKNNKNASGYTSYCKRCNRESAYKSMDKSDDRKRLLATSRISSYLKKLEHTIKLEDIVIPELCPYLGIKLTRIKDGDRKGAHDPYAPSIDRIDSTKGYIPGNIQIISALANRMKQNATPNQLIQFAVGVLKLHGIK